ncbi:glycosyltransferase family 4 protein [Algoriphagus winogradskyi]|uniref:Glycosyltransferase involved in cell wall bisynthesis n=1 Tax=Algoriphagus winogradskyi TaxID=237017 RepID=A0ABY1PJQ4_9BACT|nr:glycosyltransferase family 4 protein [Algoriphagus winogradskyi]SMP33414.1 Glycosyltransferase involved in cell wall bisynthesis [Algoriphagus winogradskyi]
MISKNKRVISITTNLARYGGAQKVLVDVHNGLKKLYDCKITGIQKFTELHPKYSVEEVEYLKFRPSVLRNNIVLVHARNLIPIMVFLDRILFLNAQIIYVSHNVYTTYRHLTFFPKNIVSISNSVTSNLLNYFKIRGKKIKLIYNGIEDMFDTLSVSRGYKEGGIIKILYVARVNNVKRQVRIVESLKGKLDSNIQIHFAGEGKDLDKLREICDGSLNFFVLGFVENMNRLVADYDYLMLYSSQEGLPLALLEGIMCMRPILVNDVGGNLEIGVPGKNGVELNENWNTLHEQLNNLNSITHLKYKEMAEASRQLFLEKFSYGNMIEKYSELIESLI